MIIKIMAEAAAGSQIIPEGSYNVSLNAASKKIFLTAGPDTIEIPAINRVGRPPPKFEETMFIPAGGRNWSITIKSPKHGEWTALIKYT